MLSDDADGNPNDGFAYAWETSTDGINWNAVAGATSITMELL